MGQVRGSPATPVDAQLNGVPTVYGSSTDAAQTWKEAIPANPDRKWGVLVQCTHTTLITMNVRMGGGASLRLTPAYESAFTNEGLNVVHLRGQGSVEVKPGSGTTALPYVMLEL
jgi:hypothetical protein